MIQEIKPICVIYYLPDIMIGNGGLMLSIREANELFANVFPGYLTLAVPSNLSADGSCDDIRLQVFHPKDFTEMQYEEMKQLIANAIEQAKINKP